MRFALIERTRAGESLELSVQLRTAPGTPRSSARDWHFYRAARGLTNTSVTAN